MLYDIAVKGIAMFKKVLNRLRNIYQLMSEPDALVDKLIRDKNRKTQSIGVALLYIIAGYMFQHNWPFPHFRMFTVCFILIGMVAIFSIIYFSRKMQSITSSIANQKPAEKANIMYYSYGKKSRCYILIPFIVVCIFGYGGCSIFGALQMTPTLIWMLFLFGVVVYISIIGYLKYIILAIYLYKLSASEFMYKKLPKSNIECIPIHLKWIQDLAKLYHTYRSAFFSVGGAYTIAYGAFCWLPEMGVVVSNPFFYVLWGIISIAVILIFPIISLLEYQWIKKIVERLKCSYINDMFFEEKHMQTNSKTGSMNVISQKIMKTMYVAQIMDSQDYPIKSLLSTSYSVCITVFNIFASVVTIIADLPMLPDDFLQIF